MTLPTLTTIAAIALWGRHPILVIGGETKYPAKALAGTMAEALPDLQQREQEESLAIWRRAGLNRGRYGAERRPPDVHALPGDAVLGNESEPVGLAELAHKGVLGADDIQAWEERPIADLLVAAFEGRAHRKGAPRALRCDCGVTASATGCKCADRAQTCVCGEDEVEAARRELWAVTAYHLFDIAVPGPGRDEEIDPAELRATYEGGKQFALTTRDQPRANSRTRPPARGAGWSLTRSARARLDALGATPGERDRVLQVARSTADIDKSRRIDECHVAAAEAMTAEQRRYGNPARTVAGRQYGSADEKRRSDP